VGYLGPAGTFSEEALLASADPDAIVPVALNTIYEVVVALRQGEVDWGIVPIENSLDGSVTVTLDLLAETGSGLEIVGETLLRVRHALIAAEVLPLTKIETVISHPKVPGQCTHFLRTELPHARVLPASSTAEAVRAVIEEGNPGQAALGTELAAKIYGGRVLRADVQDRDDNETRFVWIARSDSQPAATSSEHQPPFLRSSEAESSWKTSLMFWGPEANHPGWLVRCLNEFAARAINLTKIESRPRRASMGHYMFFVDLQGRLSEESVAAAVSGLQELCREVRILGSYRCA
jgi:prephenate dehydratase